jgi:hypothetical protein
MAVLTLEKLRLGGVSILSLNSWTTGEKPK